MSAGDDQKTIKTLSQKYNKPDVKRALKDMYSGYCCYCEQRIDQVGQIEHREPWKRFPNKTFDWNNLHWSCGLCNRKKGDQWNDDAPILDSVSDNLEEHFTFTYDTHLGVIHELLSERGETTVTHADLDRDDLIYARGLIYTEAILALLEYQKAKDSHPMKAREAIRRLRMRSKREYGSVIDWALNDYADLQ